jgi:Predicted membrane protein involved in D-alanine export
MVFSSNVFLFMFLPVFLALYYLSGQRYRNLLLLLASYTFYAWWRVDFLALFIAVTLWNYWIGLKVGAAGVRTKPAQRWLLLGVVVDLAILGYFKYANFGVDSINAMMSSVGLDPFILTNVLLPIGISFYIFESISYIIDVYRGDTPATRNLIDFAAFVAIFPHLIAGPVLRFRDLADQFNNRTHTLDKFSEGATRFMQGFIKKYSLPTPWQWLPITVLPCRPRPPAMPGSERWRTPRNCISTSPVTATWPSVWA